MDTTRTMETTHTEPRHRFSEAVGSQDNRTVASLLKDLRDETTLLFRQEVALAKQEMSEKVARMARNTGYLIAGTVTVGGGVLMLLLAATAGLYVLLLMAGVDESISLWLSPLIIGIVFAAIGYGLVQKAISTFQQGSLVPERTMRTIKEDKNWMKEKVTS